MKKLLLLFVLLLLAFGSDLHARRLSPSARISLLTCAPGMAIYSIFGHNALRINDPETGMDRVYNYGTFDFNTPDFLWLFVRRELDYYVNAYPYRYFVQEYQSYQRSFDEQILSLTHEQTQAVYDFLENNLKGDNKFYRYDFFYDNCATRIRDVLFDTLGEQLKLANRDSVSNLTMRQYLDLYMKNSPWTDFGIDLGLGSVVDRQATHWETMFLPDYLAENFSNSVKQDTSGQTSFVVSRKNLYKAPSPQKATPAYLHPAFVLTILLVIVGIASVTGFPKRRKRYWIDSLLFIIMGLAGLLILFLWFGTEHSGTKANWNLIWLLPTHLLAGVALISGIQAKWLAWYMAATATLNAITLLGWFVIPQQFHVAFIPILLISLIRSLILYRKLTSPKWEQKQTTDPT